MSTAEGHGSEGGTLAPVEQIEVLLHEYDTLRDELVGNVERQQTIVTVIVTAVLAVLGLAFEAGVSSLFLLIPTAIIVVLILEAARQFSIVSKSTYVSMLERQINSIAGQPLLTWAHANSPYHFLRLRYKDPTKKGYLLNTNVLLAGFLFLLLAAFFALGLYKSGEYLYTNVSGTWLGRGAAVTAYVIGHLSLLGLVLFSRLSQEDKVLAIYVEHWRLAKPLSGDELIAPESPSQQ